MDWTQVIHCLHEISGELDFTALKSAILRHCIEQTQSRRGYLVFRRERNWLIEALGPSGVAAIVSIPFEALNPACAQVIRRGHQTGAMVQETDGSTGAHYLAFPLQHLGQFVGIVCLESERAFGDMGTPRVKALSVLSRQSAIALANASRFDDFKRASLENEERLKRSERRFRTLFETSGVGQVQISPVTFRFVNVNSKYCEMTGYSREELLQKTFLELTCPEDLHPDLERVKDLMAGILPVFHTQKRQIRKDGELGWVRITATSIRDEAGFPVEIHGIIQDVTDEVRGEKELAESVQELQRAILARDEFMAIASHELRTPLTPLKLQVQLVKRIMQDPAFSAIPQASNFPKLLEVSDQQLERLTRLVEDLLDVSRITSGKMTLHPEPLDFSALVRDLVNRFKNALDEAGCRLVMDIRHPVVGRWDRSRIEQVVVNLITNAIKYGGGKPIDVSVVRSGGNLVLRVKDEGIGVAPEDQQRIFERFERAVSVQSYGGLGLGLYIVKQIVDAHSGRIWVESQAGRGSCFVVELPLDPAY